MNQIDKARIREKDRSWFCRNMWNFMEDKEIDHDWSNGAICKVLTHDEHVHIAKQRKEWWSSRKYIDNLKYI